MDKVTSLLKHICAAKNDLKGKDHIKKWPEILFTGHPFLAISKCGQGKSQANTVCAAVSIWSMEWPQELFLPCAYV